MNWQNVYIFISSTFNDMHAERDYLIKRVFPELRMWCAEHKLKLIDIDLRWGVSEKDATENKRVVDVCLNNVDKCRPFLLCLLGQRRGWVPGLSDVNEETLIKFPGLKEYIGKSSITELEVIHGILHPLNNGNLGMRHAFFYHRKPDYIKCIESEAIRQVFERENDDAFLEMLKETYDVLDYSAEWNPDRCSMELKNVQGMDLSAGRLENFKVEDVPLSIMVTDQLKSAIKNEFPEHFLDEEELDDISRELNHQDNFLFTACDSYISRLFEEMKVLDYINGDINKPCIFTADAGMGKTSMLAWLIGGNQITDNVIYRFVGTSSASSDVLHTLHQIVEELARKGYITEDDLEDAKTNIMIKFPTILRKIKGKCNIILDAVDQWNHLTPSSFRWLPETLPENVKILLSVKKDGQEDIIKYFVTKNYLVKELNNITDEKEKTAIIAGYLSSFLKDIDEKQIAHILSLPGSGNPLYLKIVLNELRIHGSFDTLMEQLQKDYGSTPKEAFQMVLNRLETEEFGSNIPAKELVKYVLGVTACSTEGVFVEEFGTICKNTVSACKSLPVEEILDEVYGLIRHLSTYLVIDGNRVNFLYDSFRQAVKERYEDAYHEFHYLLTMAYSRYCYQKGGSTYNVSETTCLTNYIYHAIECSKAWAETILTDPWFVYRLVSNISAGQTASYFRKIAEKYPNADEYSEIADFMERYSMRLNIGPNTLFDMMKRQIGFKNPLVYQLCDKASKVMELEYYYPAKEEIAAGLSADRELDLYSGTGEFLLKPVPFIWRNYVLYTEDDTILFQNLYTEEIEKQFTLRYEIHRSYVQGDYLYVHYVKRGDMDNAGIETFLLPSLESVFYQEGRPELPDKFQWYSVVYGINGVQYQYAMDYHEEHPELYVYNLNTRSVQIHSTFSKDLERKNEYNGHEVTWCGEYLKEESALFQKCRIWHVPTGKMLLETECDRYYFIAFEKNDMWFTMVSRNGQLTSYHYRKEDEENITLIDLFEMTNKSLIRIEQIDVLDGNLYLFFDSGDFWVLNDKFEFIGRQRLPFKISKFSGTHHSYNQFLYSNGEYMLFDEKTQVILFDKKTCMSSLLQDMELGQNTDNYTTRQFGNYLTFLGKHACHSMSLRTLKYLYSEQHPGFSFFEPRVIHVGENRLISDTTAYGDKFGVTMIHSYNLSVGLRFYAERPEGTRRAEFAFYHEGLAGVVLWNEASEKKEVREHTTNPELEDPENKKIQSVEQKNYDSFTIAYYDVKNSFQHVDTWQPDIWVPIIRCSNLMTIHNIPYLVFTDVYVDEDHSEIQVYHPITKVLVYAYRYDHTVFSIGSADELFNINEHLFVRCFNYAKTTYQLWEIDIFDKSLTEHTIPTRYIHENYGNELYLYDSSDKAILIYDMDKKEVVHQFKTRLPRFCYDIIQKDNRIIVCLSGGVCEVYDRNTMTYLYSQMLLPNYSVVKDLEDTDMIFTSKDSSDYTIFKLGNTRDLM